MLTRLRIADLALVEDVEIDLGPGLNVLTGETGAGKTVIVESIGLLVGAASGYFGGIVDTVMMRITDLFLSFPSLVLTLAFVAALGPGLEHAVMAIALTAWPPIAFRYRSGRGS